MFFIDNILRRLSPSASAEGLAGTLLVFVAAVVLFAVINVFLK